MNGWLANMLLQAHYTQYLIMFSKAAASRWDEHGAWWSIYKFYYYKFIVIYN